MYPSQRVDVLLRDLASGQVPYRSQATSHSSASAASLAEAALAQLPERGARHVGGAAVADNERRQRRYSRHMSMHSPSAGPASHRGRRRSLQWMLLGGVLFISAAASQDQPAAKQVLLLESFNRGNVVLDEFNGQFRVRLDQLAGKPVNVVEVTVGPTGFVGASGPAVADYIRSMYADRPPPDLIVAASGTAVEFARHHRQALFPDKPLLFAAVDRRIAYRVPLRENEAAAPVANDFPRLIDGILQVLPETRQIFMLNGAGAPSAFWRRELETEFRRLSGRVTFVWSEEFSLQDILRRVASLPPHTAIVYLNFVTDVRGAAYADAQVLADIHAKANAPLFGLFSTYLGAGAVGGPLISIPRLAQNTADAANRILQGAPAASVRVPPLSAGQPTFDWRELQRWGIPESRLPPDSVVEFRGPSLWDEYQAAILAAIGVLLSQSILIAWLLYERRARQHAEANGRRNLALAADANRRETISTLATSIAHELGQPLSAILSNAQVLQAMVEADRATPDATGEIVADIRTEATLASQIIERHRAMVRGHQLQKKPIDLHRAIHESVALVAHDLKTRRIEASLDLAPAPLLVEGDQVLLQQVLVNLIRNAMDALQKNEEDKRRVTIRTASAGGRVEVSVCDTGAGLSAEAMRTLFMPFVTTKPDGLGLGLAITQRIVEAHEGTIAVHGNADGGATFTVTLPGGARPGLLRRA
ncbi:HAMP domain-containing sensor histidine kinase [Ramlibacter sp. PS3R-8]|uniref:sensor histidine kinase n=1 Tax=Ramlibacter sp. PS3R-8 TaxID=3133437 RepID=UPI003098B630